MGTSIVVVSFNNLSATHKCISSILGLLNSSRELIVVDNNSTDGSKEYVKRLNELGPNIKGILLDDNLGPGIARNAGLKSASGKKVLFLDNDTFANRGEDFITVLEGKMQQLSADIVGMCGVVTFDFNTYIHVHQKDINVPMQTMSVTSYCMMANKETCDAVGGFDPIFGLFVDEDLDFCFKALINDKKIWLVDNIPLTHTEHGSGFATSDKFNKMMLKNHAILESKYSNQFARTVLDSYKTSLVDSMVKNKFSLNLTNVIGKYYFFDSSSAERAGFVEKNSL